MGGLNSSPSQFSILPDGRIRLSDGKFTAPGFYESQVQIVEEKDAYRWTIVWNTTRYQYESIDRFHYSYLLMDIKAPSTIKMEMPGLSETHMTQYVMSGSRDVGAEPRRHEHYIDRNHRKAFRPKRAKVSLHLRRRCWTLAARGPH